MKQLIANLNELGLTTYQARVYLTLLRYGDLTASRIARYGGIPSNKCYESARGLESLGFVTRSVRSPFVYRAEEPRLCIERLLEVRRQEKDELKHDFVQRAGSISRESPEVGGVWYHTMKEVARGSLRDMMRSAKRELILLNANGTEKKFRRTLDELSERIPVTVRQVEGEADILIVDRERTYFLPHKRGGVEVAFPSVAGTLAGMVS
ncbi:MAG: helix-turn-helix domain-containing protein [Methanopyri archaeon]|nr:helix-turn-helix domain-containing protein [Methanopyri archaeon]